MATDSRITIDDFMKVELRTAKVLAAEKVPNSRKLVKLSDRRRDGAADAGRRHRRSVRARSARRPHHRDGLQPETGKADGDRIERHGTGRQPRRREADARRLRSGDTAGNAGQIKRWFVNQPISPFMIDSHCHLASNAFVADLSAVVGSGARRRSDRRALHPVGGRRGRSGARGGVGHAWPAVRFAVGVHPHQAGDFAGPSTGPSTPSGARCVRRQACAIGEIGLDYHYDFSPRAVQQEIFRAQLRLARELRLPVVIHTREATDDTFRMLREEGAGEVRGVFHCFTGDEAMARAALEIDFYLSFAGIVTFPRAESAARRGEDRAGQSRARRDRCAVPGARPAPREAQRAGLCRARD